MITLRKREDTGILRRKNEIALSGELALEEAIILSQHRQRNEWALSHTVKPLVGLSQPVKPI
jgi:hypothetical protein